MLPIVAHEQQPNKMSCVKGKQEDRELLALATNFIFMSVFLYQVPLPTVTSDISYVWLCVCALLTMSV